MVQRETNVERHSRKLESGKTVPVKRHIRKLDPLKNPYQKNNPGTREQKDMIIPGNPTDRKISIEEFKPILKDTMKEIDQKEMYAGIIPLPELKKDLDKKIKISQETFEDYLIKSEKDYFIIMEPANDPYALKPERKKYGFDYGERGFMYFAILR